jgi:hypothetical protein
MTRDPSYHGTHEHAVRFALEVHDDTLQTYEFLKAWSEGNLDEWPEFYEWLDQQPLAVDHSSENARLVAALTEAELSLKAIGYPQPNDPPDAHICGVIARSALVRIEQRRRTQ